MTRATAAPATRRTAIVVPCFDEAARLDGNAFLAFAAREAGVRFVLVDDGSRDHTAEVLESLCTRMSPRAEVLRLERNSGKAEAVRRGVLRALEHEPEPRYVGYWDADLATPLDAIPEFEAILDRHPELDVVLGARVRLMGRQIERSALRHYLGRVFATAASLVLQMPIYDTQCGAKLLRVGPRGLFADPFVTNWTFDVELVARMLAAERSTGRSVAERIYEHPLWCWRDVRGSKVRPLDFLRASRDLLRIRRRYLRGR